MQVSEKVEKSRVTVLFPLMCGSRGSIRWLAKAAGGKDLGIQAHLCGSVWQFALKDDTNNCNCNWFPTWSDRCLHQHPQCAEAQGSCICQSHSRGLRGLLGGHDRGREVTGEHLGLWRVNWHLPARPSCHHQGTGLPAEQSQVLRVHHSWPEPDPAPFCQQNEDGKDSVASRVPWQLSGVGLDIGKSRLARRFVVLIRVHGWSGAWCVWCFAFFHVPASRPSHRVESQGSTWHMPKSLVSLCTISNTANPKVPQVTWSLRGECGKIAPELDHWGGSQLDIAERSACRKAKTMVGKRRSYSGWLTPLYLSIYTHIYIRRRMHTENILPIAYSVT